MLLGTGSKNNIDISSVVNLSLLHNEIWQMQTYLSTTDMGLALFLLFDLGGLVLDLTSTSKRTMDLTTTTETEDQVESRFLLNVVIGEGATIFKLLTSEDQTLLVWGNSFLVLDLGLDVFDGIRGFNIEGNSLSYKLATSHPKRTSKSLNENLHCKPT